MSVKLAFSFPVDITPALALREVADHFGARIEPTADGLGLVIHFGTQQIPAHIKTAVETVGSEIIAAAQEMNPAVAFGGLLNGAAGNAPAIVDVPSSVDAATLTTVQTGQPVISATTPPASSLSAAPATVVVQPGNVEQVNPANVDKNGLPWDARIHSSPAAITDKGVWRKKRGATPTVVKQVEDELRRIVGNAAPAASVVANVAPTDNAQSFANDADRKAAALEHAHRYALQTVGASPIDDATLQGMLNGKPATLSPDQNDWFSAYYPCRNKAYSDFLAVSAVTAVNEQPATITNAVAEQPAIPSIPVASLAAAVGTQTVVTIAPPASSPDATGLPFDARIHVTPPTTDSAGVFIQRMDVEPAFKLQVMAELRAAGNAIAAPVSTAPAIPVSSAPVAPVVGVENPGTSFPLLMQWIVRNQLAKRIAPAQVAEVAQVFGYVDQATGVGAIAQAAAPNEYNAQMWPQIAEALKMYGAV